MNKVFDEIYETVWKSIFPGLPPLDLGKFTQLYTKDIILPQEYKSAQSGASVYSTSEYGYKRFVSPEEVQKRSATDNYMEPKKDISSLADVMTAMKTLAMFRGSRSLNSEVIEQSDDVYSSSYIFRSAHVYSSQKLMFNYNTKTSEYLLASKGSADSAFGIRIMDSSGVSNSFDVTWSAKCANSYFCHSSFDLRDCMFCFHLTSKQYCIANMQFSKEEYETLKTTILKEYFDQLLKPGAFVTQADF